MRKIIQSDVEHNCKSVMWHCTSCKDDFCMADKPKFCPMCGVEPDDIVVREKELHDLWGV